MVGTTMTIQACTRWRTRPVEKEALYFDGTFESYEKIFNAFGRVSFTGETFENAERRGKIIVPTLEGTIALPGGYFIVKGLQGELYGCEEGVFYKSYEPIGDGW